MHDAGTVQKMEKTAITQRQMARRQFLALHEKMFYKHLSKLGTLALSKHM